MDMATALAELGVTEATLDAETAERLDRDGYAPLPGVLDEAQLEAIRARLAELMAAEGDQAGTEVHQEAGTDRLADLVNKGEMFRPCFTDARLLACMAHVLGDFKLSSLNFRAALPGQGHQNLHTDWGGPVEPGEYQVCNAIWLLDDFTASNGPGRPPSRRGPGHRAGGHRRRVQQPPMARWHPEPQRPSAPRHALLLHPPRSRPAAGPEEVHPPADPDRPQPRRPFHPGRAVMSQFTVRPAWVADARPMAELFAAVAEERSGIASEPPVDVDARTVGFTASVTESMVAVASDRVIGMIHVEVSRHGFGEFGMLVDREWRGRGVGSALIRAAIGWARDQGLHKLCLEVFAQNTAAIALYRKYGFVEEGHRVKHYRRANGELWDSLVMGLPLS
jgi:RimJ/RimL family protein N-acetyltransferase